MIQLLFFTGMIAIIQIEAVMVQAVTQMVTFHPVIILNVQDDIRLILVEPDCITDVRSAEIWALSAES